MVKTLQKSSSPEPLDRFPRNLVCSIGDSCPSLFVQMMAWVDLDLFYGKVKFCYLGFTIGKMKTGEFSEAVAADDLKNGRCRQLIELMKVFEN